MNAEEHSGFEFQFTHLSLQEYLLADQLIQAASEDPGFFWGTRGTGAAATQLNKFLNQNTFRIGGATLGQTLVTCGMFSQHLKLTDVGW